MTAPITAQSSKMLRERPSCWVARYSAEAYTNSPEMAHELGLTEEMK